MRQNSLSTIVVAIVTVCGSLHAESHLEPFVQSGATGADGSQKIGWYLEQAFSSFMGHCQLDGGLFLANRNNKLVKISTVPQSLWDPLVLSPWDWVATSRPYSMARAFSYLTPEPVLNTSPVSDSDYLTMDYTQNHL